MRNGSIGSVLRGFLRSAFRMAQAAATSDGRVVVVELTIGDEAVLTRAGGMPAIGMRWSREHVRGFVRRASKIVVLPNLHRLLKSLADRTGVSNIQ